MYVCVIPPFECAASGGTPIEDALLSAVRQVGMEDDINAGNWQELLRWYIRSKLDAQAIVELNGKQTVAWAVKQEAGTVEEVQPVWCVCVCLWIDGE